MNKMQLYSLSTPNGQKVSVALEEMKIDYEAHRIDITKGDQFTDDFVRMNPNSKIPVLVDPDGPRGQSLTMMESGAILMYLAEKTGLFLPKDPIRRHQSIQWLFFQVGGVGPMFGQFGHFYKYATEQCDHPYPVQRYQKEVCRLLAVLDKQLSHQDYLVGELSIADFATAPWVMCLDVFYEASDVLQLSHFQNVQKWMERLMKRPKFVEGLKVCQF